MIDGSGGKSYTDYTTSSGLRHWVVKINFTAKGNRKVQFKCSMVSGSTVLIPSKAVTIKVAAAS
jgi:hypothetical protein